MAGNAPCPDCDQRCVREEVRVRCKHVAQTIWMSSAFGKGGNFPGNRCVDVDEGASEESDEPALASEEGDELEQPRVISAHD